MMNRIAISLLFALSLIMPAVSAAWSGSQDGSAGRAIPQYSFHIVENTTYYGGIHSIAKDRVGRIWFSGHEALCMYDGSVFVRMEEQVTRIAPSDSWNFGEVKTAGAGSLLIVGSNHGLILLDYDSMSFECIFPGNIGPFDVTDSGEVWMVRNGSLEMFHADDINGGAACFDVVSAGEERVSSVFSTGNDVYASVGNALFRYCRENSCFLPFASVGGDDTEIKDVLGYGETVYVLTLMDGLFCCLPDGSVRRSSASGMISDRSSSAKMLYMDYSGIIWMATQAGLLLMDPESETTRLLRMDLNRPYSLPNNSVWSIFPDPDGGLWIGTYGGKLAYSTLEENDVTFFTARPGGLSSPIVSCFAEDRHGNLWVGTEGGGISLLDRETGLFRYIAHDDGSGLASDFIKRIWKDDDGAIWVASFNGGVQVYDERTGMFRMVAGSLSQYPLSVYDFLMEGDDGIWLSSPDENLRYKDKASGRIEDVHIIDADGSPYRRLSVEMMFHDDSGNLCLVSHSGFFVVDIHTHKVLKRYFLEDSPFSVNNLTAFCRTSSGDIWLGTGGGGVNVLYADGRYCNLVDSDGWSLMGKTVFGIVQDEGSGDIWLSTDSGIYVYGHESGRFSRSRIDSNDNCGSYYIRSYFRTSEGEILFGGTDGFVMFTPSRIAFNRQKPSVFFTGFMINSTIAVPSVRNSPLRRSITAFRGDGSDECIRLSHRQSNFGVLLSSDSYLNADKNQYAYRMKGLSDDWMTLPQGQRSVSFFNMRPGKYRLEVKAANNDGVWGDRISSLRIEVRPSPFLSLWAYLAYAAIAVSVILACWRFSINKKILEQKLELEHIKEENMREMTQARINFFTSISHDLKTPLTLVVDPLKQLKEHVAANSPAMTYVNLIEQNVVRIQRMIIQLLQFREIESQKLSLDRQPGDLVRFIGNVFSLFEGIAVNKDIETSFRSDQESFYTLFDYDVMEKIVTNLLSNAFKYTPRGCFVGLSVSVGHVPDGSRKLVSITVTNTGSDIPEDKREVIFDAFSRLPSSVSPMENSTGLGLAIVKELVDNLGGRIVLKSENSTVSFEVQLPFVPEGEIKEDTDGRYEYAASEADNLLKEESVMESDGKGVRKPNSVVVIEDDVNLRNYLEMRLSQKYNVYTATNGTDGISKAIKVNPQLIVTDLMMPEADGFEVCRNIRSDIRTSHIPVIVLSGAGNNDDNRIKAMECGASVFIDKPVDMDFLMKQLDSLVGSMQRLKEMYSKKYIAEPSKITISSMDEELLKRAMDNIERNMDNSDYDVDSFVSDMAVGRTILYRKINDITGMSIKEFIMDVRLKRAAQLLKESEYTISEISAMTGFVNPKYFSICFRRHFEISPSEFRKGKGDTGA
ncbi:MAG: response regulator [Clostridium sp.]|nr:response regulator [Clostridium sp.]